jgi:uncharacterized SAM-binding protein YcdF (DUF218 family)
MPQRTKDSPPIDWDAILTLGLTLALLLLTLGGALIAPLRQVLRASRTPAVGLADPGPWLLVPGKRLVNDRPDRDFTARLRAAATLAGRHPGCTILILGGVTGRSTVSEAAAGERFLRSLPEGTRLRVRQEADSRDTLTNLRNARDVLASTASGLPVVVVSNRYHLRRIGLIASSLRIQHRFVPAETTLARGPGTWGRLLVESFYCLWFGVGKGWARRTRNRRMLARVS